jgi:hypothetical protein
MKINFFNLFVVHINKFERESVLTWYSVPGNSLIGKAYIVMNEDNYD